MPPRLPWPCRRPSREPATPRGRPPSSTKPARRLADLPGPTLLEVMAAQAMMLVRGGGPHAAPRSRPRDRGDLADELGIAAAAPGADGRRRRRELRSRDRDLRLPPRPAAGLQGPFNCAFHFRGRADAWTRVIDDSIEFDRAHGITNLSTRNIRAFTSFWFLGRPEGLIDDLESLHRRGSRDRRPVHRVPGRRPRSWRSEPSAANPSVPSTSSSRTGTPPGSGDGLEQA